MFALLIIGFAYTLFSGLDTSIVVKESGGEYSGINPGQTIMRRINGKRAWLTRLSTAQKEQRKLLNPLLVNPNSGCGSNKSICAILALVSDNGLELSYTKAPPPQLKGDVVWFGGFVDPITGAVFDLRGRAYRLNRPSDAQTLQVIDLD
jgi:hypothetical protein